MKWWQKLFNIPIEYVYINTDVVCPECTKTCPEDKLWVHYLTFIDQFTGDKYTYITEMGKPFYVAGWTGLAITEIDVVSMDISNKSILNKLVKVK